MTKNVADDMLYQTRAGFNTLADNKDAILVIKDGEEFPKDLKDAQALELPPLKDAEETKNAYNDTNNELVEPFNLKEE